VSEKGGAVTEGESQRAVGIGCLGVVAGSVEGHWAVAGLGVVAVRALLSCVCSIDWWTDLWGIGAVAVLRREALTQFLRDEDGCCGVMAEAGLVVKDTPSRALKSEV
jgi:hypothetical protein